MIRSDSVDIARLGLSLEIIAREMGYRSVEPTAGLRKAIRDTLDEVLALARPSYAFRLLDGEIKGEELAVDGAVFSMGTVIPPLLAGSKRFAFFTATAGADFQDYLSGIATTDDILRNYIADVIGSCLVESVGDFMERRLEEFIAPFQHTNRFSPGYCGWSLWEQKKLFSLLGGTPCGIQLSDYCLMTPEKSISGIIGIGEKVNEKAYGCQYCELKTCYRHKRR